MNGNFEVDSSAYPIGYLRIGDGYKVCDMRNLAPLHSHPIPLEDCKRIAAGCNGLIRQGLLSNEWLSEEVAAWVAEEVAALDS